MEKRQALAEEAARERRTEREREILVGFIMVQAKVSEADAEFLLTSGQWELAMSNVRSYVLFNHAQAEAPATEPIMLTESTDG